MKLTTISEILEKLPAFECCEDCCEYFSEMYPKCREQDDYCLQQIDCAEEIYELFVNKINFADNIDELRLMIE